ncbi:MAG: tyrosine-type recombinase/integrase [Gammaproteobacteria bacterium]|nr:tyrosine-type recombinase/integrase [Gammaproteobacteria bacterium]
MAEIADQGKAGSTVAQAMSAVLWALSVKAGGQTQPQVLPTWVAAAARRTGPAPARKATATLEHLRALHAHWKSQKSALALRSWTIPTVLFAGCMRFGDVRKIKRSHFKFGENSVELTLPSSKTDQTQQGSTTPLAAAGEEALCPVRALRIWFQSGNIGPDERDFAFPSLNNKEQAITYSAYSDSLKKGLREAGLVRITPHSFRKGSATRAH